MSEKRDPRKAPDRGDVLRMQLPSGGYWTRTVVEAGPCQRNGLYGFWVVYALTLTDGKTLTLNQSCLLSSWRRWAKDATVVTGGAG